MAISASEQLELVCVACKEPFETEVWRLVDAAERPDLAQALLDGTLNMATCPHCGASNQSQIAMLYHDPARRRVHFAAPADVAEHRWHDLAQTLLFALAEQLPEEARLPYLDDVHVNQEIAGVRRALLRGPRVRGGDKPTFGKPIPLPDSGTPLLVERPERQANTPAAPAALAAAVEEVVAVGSLDELRAAVVRHPALLGLEADELLRQLADATFNQGDRETATALHAARNALADLRAGHEISVAVPEAAIDAAMPLDDATTLVLPEPAYQALLHTASDAALMEAIRTFPVLLEPWADEDLGQRIEAALFEENERLATLIEDRRDALAALRNMLFAEEALERSVQALLAAPDTDALESVLSDHPQLLTDVAQQALAVYAAAARVRNDERAASTAEARREILQQVRTGINR